MFDVKSFDVEKYDLILSRGLCVGKGTPDKQMCIEAAICNVLGIPHNDDPECVARAVRTYKITLNDASWSSPEARAKGLRDLGLAQLGSLGIIKNEDFSTRLTELTIRTLIPTLFREILAHDPACMSAADRCEKHDNYISAAHAAADTASHAANAAARAARAADSYAAITAARAARAAARAARAAATNPSDKYLILSAQLSLQVLKELNSPGCQLL